MTDREMVKFAFESAGVQREQSFSQAIASALIRGSRHIVATGCFRGIPGDGQSDSILSRFADHVEGTYDCVDINPDHIEKAKQFPGISRNARFHCMCSVEYLKRRSKPVDFLYLDSVDFDPTAPEESQKHQLCEIVAAFPVLSPNAVVLLDDVGSPYGNVPIWLKLENQGKGKLSSDFLLRNGFECVLKSYQWLFVRNGLDTHNY